MEYTNEYKYDVFISYSRKDYVDESKNIFPNNAISAVKDAFDKNGITYWFDEEGIYSGQAFVDIITEAIALSKAFVFISSKNSNHSKWTKSEILEAFDSDKTIIPFKIDNTEYDKSLKFFLRPLDFIPYFENKDNAIQELIRSVQKVKDDIAEEEKKRQAETRILGIKAKIKELAEDYRRLTTQQETILDELVEQSRLLGIEDKQCPICGKSSKIDVLFCDRCGWTFHPLFSMVENYSLPNHKVLFSIFKAQWMSNGRIGEVRKKLDELTTENEQLKELLKETQEKLDEERNASKEKESKVLSYRDEIAALQRKLAVITSENEQLKTSLDITKQDLEERTTVLVSRAESLQAKTNTLQNKLSEQKTLCEQYEQKLKQLEIDYQKSQERIKELEDNKSSTDSLYDVILVSAGSQKLAVVKMTKELTDLGLKESKELVDAAPSTIITSLESTTAITIREIFQNVGANVELRKSTGQSHKRIDNFLESYSSYAPRASQYTPNTLYDLILVSSGPLKLAVVKLVKNLTYLGLKESKDLVDAAPSTILKNLSITQARKIADQFKECEAQVELSPSI